jgi:hypothetical protein
MVRRSRLQLLTCTASVTSSFVGQEGVAETQILKESRAGPGGRIAEPIGGGPARGAGSSSGKT